MFLCGWRTNIIISLEVFYCKLKHFQPPAEQVVYLFGYILILYIQVFFLPNGALPQQSERIASSVILLIALPAGPCATRTRYTKKTIVLNKVQWPNDLHIIYWYQTNYSSHSHRSLCLYTDSHL